MLNRFFRRNTPDPQQPEPAPDADAALDDVDLRNARQRAVAGDWAAARATIESAGTDWERRGHRAWVLGKAAAADDAWLREWLAVAADDPTAWTLKANVDAERAANARGAAAAKHTTADQFRSFHELMAQAQTSSERAITLAPGDPTPWLQYLWSLFPDGRRHRDEFARRFAELRRRDPHHYTGHEAALQFYCEKWYGSHDEMYSMAREAAAAAAPGAAVAMLPVQAHIEYCLREFFWDGREGMADAREFFGRPEIQRELDGCVAKWRAAGQPRHALAMKTRSVQAVAYVFSDRLAEMATVYDEMGPHLGEGYPWYYFWDAQDAFVHYRHYARAA